MKKREIVLTDENVRAMLKEAKGSNERDYLLLALMANCGLRRAELVGGDDSRVPEEKRLPGLLIENLRDGGVYVLGKKADREVFVAIPLPLLTELQHFLGAKWCEIHSTPINNHPEDCINLCLTGPIFDYSTDSVYKLCLKYARKAVMADWERVHPHRLRHFFITRVAKQTGRDTWKTRDMARHKNVATTNRYVAEVSPEEKRHIAESIEIV